MITTQYLFESSINKITFTDFDKKLYDLLPEDKKLINISPQGNYYTIILSGKAKIGFCGVILSKIDQQYGFFQIYIIKEYRGRKDLKILKTAAKFLYNKHNLRTLIATIKKSNIASIKSHLNNGFIEVDKKRQEELIKLGKQTPDEIRLEYIA